MIKQKIADFTGSPIWVALVTRCTRFRCNLFLLRCRSSMSEKSNFSKAADRRYSFPELRNVWITRAVSAVQVSLARGPESGCVTVPA